MACCLAVALLIAVARRGWFRLFPAAAPPEPGFAPVARRAAPRQDGRRRAGSGPAAMKPWPGDAAPRSGRPAAVRARPLLAALTGVGPGVALYAALVALGRGTGVLVDGTDPLAGWLARDVALVALAVGALAASRRIVPRTAPVLAGAGLTLSVLSVVDMHVLRLVEPGAASPLADAVLHGAGTPLLLAALVLDLRAPRPTGRTA